MILTSALIPGGGCVGVVSPAAGSSCSSISSVCCRCERPLEEQQHPRALLRAAMQLQRWSLNSSQTIKTITSLLTTRVLNPSSKGKVVFHHLPQVEKCLLRRLSEVVERWRRCLVSSVGIRQPFCWSFKRCLVSGAVESETSGLHVFISGPGVCGCGGINRAIFPGVLLCVHLEEQRCCSAPPPS